MTSSTIFAIRQILHFGWPVRQTISGRPTVLDLKTAARWATGPVDMTAVHAHASLAATTCGVDAARRAAEIYAALEGCS